MCGVFSSLVTGSAFAFILLTSLLVSGADDDDWLTTQQCKNSDGRPGRVRQYPENRTATFLWLDYCDIDEINEDDLIGLPNITTIYLDRNAITRVDLAVFRHVPTLEYLTLYNNRLRELLGAFSEHSCPRLFYLSLYGNYLSKLNDVRTFSACTQLQELHLNNNEISHIHPDLFSLLTELKTLELYTNKLSFIPDQMFANNIKLDYLSLFNNRLTYLPQDFASSFKRAGVGLGVFYFHDNPWRCACVLELMADVKRAGVRYYSLYKYDGAQPECVFVGAVPCRSPPSGLLPPPRAVTGGGR